MRDLTLLNINTGTSGTPKNRLLYETTAPEILKIMRENPYAEIVVALQSFATADDPMGYTLLGNDAGDIFVWTNPVTRGDRVPKSVFDQLLNDGLIEKANESPVGISYELSESAK